jgi:dienelactone hydrolase
MDDGSAAPEAVPILESEVTLPGMLQRQFRVQVQDRSVPGVMWLPLEAKGRRPLVLVGHGGTGHKKAEAVVDAARVLVPGCGFVVAAIDGPVHGDRRALPAPPDVLRHEFREAWDRRDTITPMIADWRGVLDVLARMPQVDGDAVAWYGLSMGTAYGLPLVAAEPRIKVAVLGMWGLSRKHSDRLLEDAGRIQVPVLFLQQWDDERFTREEQATLFDSFPSEDRCMYVYPGGHADPDRLELADIVHFIVTRLSVAGEGEDAISTPGAHACHTP